MLLLSKMSVIVPLDTRKPCKILYKMRHFFSISSFFFIFFQKKIKFAVIFFHFFPQTPLDSLKLTKNEENLQNPNRLMKFSEIWYVDASQQKNALKKLFLNFVFFDRFCLTKKQPKLTKNEEDWQNPNRLMKFSEIWYVDASQQ